MDVAHSHPIRGTQHPSRLLSDATTPSATNHDTASHYATLYCRRYTVPLLGAIAQNRLTDRPPRPAPPRPSRRRLLHPNLPSLVRHQRRKHERKENSRCVHDSGAIPDAAGSGGGGGGGGADGRGGIAHTLKWCMRRAHANQYPPSCLMRSLS